MKKKVSNQPNTYIRLVNNLEVRKEILGSAIVATKLAKYSLELKKIRNEKTQQIIQLKNINLEIKRLLKRLEHSELPYVPEIEESLKVEKRKSSIKEKIISPKSTIKRKPLTEEDVLTNELKEIQNKLNQLNL